MLQHLDVHWLAIHELYEQLVLLFQLLQPVRLTTEAAAAHPYRQASPNGHI
ncbi:MAG: hypothetical protein KDA86_18930 [Planctomycetaceae bacterium]|nr:hypothetical protein [Planctomycetaceae bacterium]